MNRRMRWLLTVSLRLVTLATCSLAMVSHVASARAQDHAEQVASVEGVTEYRLPNGFRALLLPDPGSDSLTISLTFLVGSRDEVDGQRGTAHLLEHLLFGGTARHSDIATEMQKRGATWNATTTADYTRYYETIGANTDNLQWALDLEADRMVNTVLSPKDLTSARAVVLNELENGENAPLSVLAARVISTAFTGHTYAHDTIGTRSDIERATLDGVRAFYRRWYRPDNAVLVVAGGFETTSALHHIGAAFGRIRRPDTALPNTPTVEPAQDGERTVALRRAGDTPGIIAAWHVPAAAHPDAAPLKVLARILADEPEGPLYRSLVEPGFAATQGAAMTLARDPDLFSVRANLPAVRDVEAVRERLVSTVEKFAVTPPSRSAVTRAIDAILAAHEMFVGDRAGVGLALSRWIAAGDWQLFFLHRDRVRTVTPDDVQRVARTYLVPENRTVGIFMPTREHLSVDVPGAPPLGPILAQYTGGSAPAVGERITGGLEAFEHRTLRKTLWDGVDMALLRKGTAGDLVHFRMSMDFGDERTLAGQSAAGYFCGELLFRGTKRRPQQELSDRLTELRARLSVDADEKSATASLQVPREHLTEALSLTAEVLRQPDFRKSDFEVSRQQWLAASEAARSDPDYQASNLLDGHLSMWPLTDPRHVYTDDEMLDAVRRLTVEDVRRFYADFYGASHAQVAVVGDVAPETIEGIVRDLFADWRNRHPYAPIVSPYRVVAPLRTAVEIPDKAAAVLKMAQPMDITLNDGDYLALLAALHILGDSPTSRLWKRLRATEGLSYEVSATLEAAQYSRDGEFSVTATYPPDQTDRVMAALEDEMARALDSGFSEAEVAEMKDNLLRRTDVARASDDGLANRLGSQAWRQRTFIDEQADRNRLQSLTPAELHAALLRHVDLNEMSVVVAGSFGGKVDLNRRKRTAIGKGNGPQPARGSSFRRLGAEPSPQSCARGSQDLARGCGAPVDP